MKISWFKSILYVALLFAGLTTASCKDNKDADAMETPANTNDMDMDTEADTATVNPDTIMGP